jgi:hypothetical protein
MLDLLAAFDWVDWCVTSIFGACILFAAFGIWASWGLALYTPEQLQRQRERERAQRL